MDHASPEQRAAQIKQRIETRKEKHELYKCHFNITVPSAYADLYTDTDILKIKAMLDKYSIGYQHVDTALGAWNLNRDWVETEAFDCIVEYCGVYPVNWDMDDVVELEEMECSGKIIIQVVWDMIDGTYQLNH